MPVVHTGTHEFLSLSNVQPHPSGVGVIVGPNHWLSRSQPGMQHACLQCCNSADQAVGRTVIKCILQVNKHSGVGFFMVTRLHGVAGASGNHCCT